MTIRSKLIITFLINTVLAIIIGSLVFAFTVHYNIFIRLSDAFMYPGIIYLFYGFLLIIANFGLFDAVNYNIGNFIGSFKKDYIKRYNEFYKYKEAKIEKRKITFWSRVIPPLVIGVIFIILSAIFSFISLAHL